MLAYSNCREIEEKASIKPFNATKLNSGEGSTYLLDMNYVQTSIGRQETMSVDQII